MTHTLTPWNGPSSGAVTMKETETLGYKTEKIRFVVPAIRVLETSHILTPLVKAFGREWKVFMVYDEDNTNLGCTLRHVDGNDITVTSCSFLLTLESTGIAFEGDASCKGIGIFESNFRAVLFRGFPNASLKVECTINVEGKNAVWYPERSSPQSILLSLYDDASSETADVVFEACDNSGFCYKAHKNVLFLRWKKLYEIAKEFGSNNNDDAAAAAAAAVPVPILGMRPEVFKILLDHAYTAVHAPSIQTEELAKEILDAADRYEYVPMKLYAESVLVDRFLTPHNAAELYVLADAKSCALLKEASMCVFVRNPGTVQQSSGWAGIAESLRLVNELLGALVSHQEAAVGGNTDSNGVDKKDVTSLREELQQLKLEVDGSREVLIKRLEARKKELSEENSTTAET